MKGLVENQIVILLLLTPWSARCKTVYLVLKKSLTKIKRVLLSMRALLEKVGNGWMNVVMEERIWSPVMDIGPPTHHNPTTCLTNLHAPPNQPTKNQQQPTIKKHCQKQNGPNILSIDSINSRCGFFSKAKDLSVWEFERHRTGMLRHCTMA